MPSLLRIRATVRTDPQRRKSMLRQSAGRLDPHPRFFIYHNFLTKFILLNILPIVFKFLNYMKENYFYLTPHQKEVLKNALALWQAQAYMLTGRDCSSYIDDLKQHLGI